MTYLLEESCFSHLAPAISLRITDRLREFIKVISFPLGFFALMSHLFRPLVARRVRVPIISISYDSCSTHSQLSAVAPAPIEARFKQFPVISQAVVIGERQKYLVVLLTLDESTKIVSVS